MKLIIQIPCYNEAASLPATLAELPRALDGFTQVEWLVIDDGSGDGTDDVARTHGVDHVVRLPVNRGLAAAFMRGIDACLALGADVIVNTDADNQYRAADIPALVAPILEHRADIVVGARPIADIEHFSAPKKFLQWLGSWAVRAASGTAVADAPSGFRAMSREAALRLNVFNAYTYTLETIIQAGQSNLAIVSVPVGTNPELRPSRLVDSVPAYIGRSLATIVRVFTIYRPLAPFLGVGALFLVAGLVAGLRFLWYYFHDGGAGHVQSVVLASLCITLGTLLSMLGLIADLIATNRKLLERIDLRQRRRDFDRPDDAPPR
jgi:glycosyltransferase involved in cell wall biosynthesis